MSIGEILDLDMKSSFSKNDNLLIVFLALFRSAVALKEPVSQIKWTGEVSIIKAKLEFLENFNAGEFYYIHRHKDLQNIVLS